MFTSNEFDVLAGSLDVYIAALTFISVSCFYISTTFYVIEE